MELFSLGEPVLPRTHLSECQLPRGEPLLLGITNETLRQRVPQSMRISVAETNYIVRTVPFDDENGNVRGATLMLTEAS